MKPYVKVWDAVLVALEIFCLLRFGEPDRPLGPDIALTAVASIGIFLEHKLRNWLEDQKDGKGKGWLILLVALFTFVIFRLSSLNDSNRSLVKDLFGMGLFLVLWVGGNRLRDWRKNRKSDAT